MRIRRRLKSSILNERRYIMNYLNYKKINKLDVTTAAVEGISLDGQHATPSTSNPTATASISSTTAGKKNNKKKRPIRNNNPITSNWIKKPLASKVVSLI